MPGTKDGSIKARETIKRKYGEDFYAKIGSVGGKNGHTGGFNNRELAKRAGKLGGYKSKRVWTDEQRAYMSKIMRKRSKSIWQRLKLS